MCALLYDDVGGAIRHDLSERGQRCPGSPESSVHPTALPVSNSECILWYICRFKKHSSFPCVQLLPESTDAAQLYYGLKPPGETTHQLGS